MDVSYIDDHRGTLSEQNLTITPFLWGTVCPNTIIVSFERLHNIQCNNQREYILHF